MRVRTRLAALILPPVFIFLASAPLPASAASANTIILTDKSGTASTNYPFQFGRPFLDGAIPNYPQVLINGAPATTQADVKNRYSDGSVKFAVMAVIIPSIPANGTVTLTFQNQSSGNNTPLTASQMLDPSYGFDAQIQLVSSGVTKSASARAMLQNGDCRYWTQGAVAQTMLCADDTASAKYDFGFDSHTPFRPRFYATFWPATHQVTVRYIGEIANTTDLEDVTADLALTLGETAQSVYSHSALTTYAGTRWTKVFWINGAPPQMINIDYNAAYLAQTYYVPNFDVTQAPTASTIADEYTRWNSHAHDLYDAGLWTESMGEVGGRPDLGPPFTQWDVNWVLTGDWRARLVALGQADLAGAWASNLREGNPTKDLLRTDTPGAGTGLGLPISLTDHKTLNFYHLTDTQANIEDQATIVGPTYQWTTSDAVPHWGAISATHQVDPFTPAYILTGDPFYLEQDEFWNAFAAGVFSMGGISYGRGPDGNEGGIVYDNETRGDGRVLYNRAVAAQIEPDSSPLKTYFTTLTNDAIAEWEGMQNITNTPNFGNKLWKYGNLFRIQLYKNSLPSPLHFWMQNGNYTPQGFSSAYSGAIEDTWMRSMLVVALQRAEELGFPTEPLLNWQMPWLYAQIFTPGVDPHIIGLYETIDTDSSTNWLTSWAQIYNELDPTYATTQLVPYFNSKLTGSDLGDGYPEWAMAAAAALAGEPGGAQLWNWFQTNVYNVTPWPNDPRLAILPRSTNASPYIAPTPVTLADLAPGVILYSQHMGTPQYIKQYGPNYYHIDWVSRGANSCTGTGFPTGGARSGSYGIVITSTQTFTITCTGSSGTFSDTETVVPSGGTGINPPPTASLTAAPNSITSGQSSTLTWSSTNATSCTGSGFSASGTSGSATVSPTTTTTYSITCTGSGGSASASASVTVSASATIQNIRVTGPFSETDTCSGVLSTGQSCSISVSFTSTAAGTQTGTLSFLDTTTGTTVTVQLSGTGVTVAVAPTATLTASPTFITLGTPSNTNSIASQSSTLTWSSTNATSCIGTGFTASGTSGSAIVSPTTTTTYSLTCTGAGGSATASATVTVGATPAPTVILSASPSSISSGQSSTLTWNSTNATSCIGTGFSTNNVSVASGSVVVSPIVTTTYSLICTGAGGSATASATVTVTASNSNQTNTASAASVFASLRALLERLWQWLSDARIAAAPSSQAAAVTLSATSLNFGSVSVGHSSIQTLTITAPSSSGGGSGGSNRGSSGGGGGGIITVTPSAAAGSAGPSPSTSAGGSSQSSVSVSTLTRSLFRGLSGSDVTSIQDYLIAHGYLLSGDDTGYFGPLTEAAVQKLQCALAIICSGDPASTGWGVAGPRTRELLDANSAQQ